MTRRLPAPPTFDGDLFRRVIRAAITGRRISMRTAATEAGVSPATICRIDSTKAPDVESFGRLCAWLRLDPGMFFKQNGTEAM